MILKNGKLIGRYNGRPINGFYFNFVFKWRWYWWPIIPYFSGMVHWGCFTVAIGWTFD
jgi:hypothetical protein